MMPLLHIVTFMLSDDLPYLGILMSWQKQLPTVFFFALVFNVSCVCLTLMSMRVSSPTWAH